MLTKWVQISEKANIEISLFQGVFNPILFFITKFYNDTATISSQGLHLQASTVKIKCSKPHQTSAVAYFTTSSMDVHPSLLPEATSVTKFDIS